MNSYNTFFAAVSPEVSILSGQPHPSFIVIPLYALRGDSESLQRPVRLQFNNVKVVFLPANGHPSHSCLVTLVVFLCAFCAQLGIYETNF